MLTQPVLGPLLGQALRLSLHLLLPLLTAASSVTHGIFFLNTWKQHPEEKAPGKKPFLYFFSFYLISASVTNINIQCSSLFVETQKHFKKALWFLISASWTQGDYFISRCEHLQARAHTLRSRVPLTLSTSHMWPTKWSHQNAQNPTVLKSVYYCCYL